MNIIRLENANGAPNGVFGKYHIYKCLGNGQHICIRGIRFQPRQVRFQVKNGILLPVPHEHGLGLPSPNLSPVEFRLSPRIEKAAKPAVSHVHGLPLPSPNLFPKGVSDEMAKKYKFHRKLGSGHFGSVYLVQHMKTQKKFAMKVIPKHLNATSREARIMDTLRHPNLTRLYDFSNNSEYLNLVMDYMKGRSLDDRLKSVKRLSETTARFYFLQMSEAINYLHEKNVTHRDLKPDNILLASDDERTLLKISDFGLSKNDMENYLTSNCGTVCYMAPEYFANEIRRYSNKVDIWSLGVMFYECLSGDLPFSNPRAIVNSKCDFQQTAWKTVSNDAIKIINQMLTKNPNQRPDISFPLESSLLNDSRLKRMYQQLLKKHE